MKVLTKPLTRDKGGHYITLEGLIQQEDITVVSIYAPNMEAPRYIKKLSVDFKGQIVSNNDSRGLLHPADING